MGTNDTGAACTGWLESGLSKNLILDGWKLSLCNGCDHNYAASVRYFNYSAPAIKVHYDDLSCRHGLLWFVMVLRCLKYPANSKCQSHGPRNSFSPAARHWKRAWTAQMGPSVWNTREANETLSLISVCKHASPKQRPLMPNIDLLDGLLYPYVYVPSLSLSRCKKATCPKVLPC